MVTLRDSAIQLGGHVVEQVHVDVVKELVDHLHGSGHHGMLHLVMEMWLGFGWSLWPLRYNFYTLSASAIFWKNQDLDKV